MQVRIKFLIFLIILALSVSCVSGVKVTEVAQSLDEIRASIQTLAVDFKQVNQNRRIYESRYFARDPQKKFDSESAPERLFARFSILGDRRPYEILVQVFVEKKDPKTGEYVFSGEDEQLATQIANDLVRILIKSRAERNAIDSFRVF